MRVHVLLLRDCTSSLAVIASSGWPLLVRLLHFVSGAGLNLFCALRVPHHIVWGVGARCSQGALAVAGLLRITTYTVVMAEKAAPIHGAEVTKWTVASPYRIYFRHAMNSAVPLTVVYSFSACFVLFDAACNTSSLCPACFRRNVACVLFQWLATVKRVLRTPSRSTSPLRSPGGTVLTR